MQNAICSLERKKEIYSPWTSVGTFNISTYTHTPVRPQATYASRLCLLIMNTNNVKLINNVLIQIVFEITTHEFSQERIAVSVNFLIN